MKSISIATLLALSSLTLPSSSWPLIPNPRDARKLSPRRPATYSVVAVDGGSSSAAPATQTVTQPITQTVLSTMVSTIVVTEAETPTTILVTFISTSATTVFETPSAVATTTMISTTIERPSLTPAATGQQTTATTSQDSPITITLQPSPITTTATDLPPMVTTEVMETLTVTAPPVAPSSMPYDDGMWHTTYYHAVTAEEAAPTIATDSAVSFYTSGTSSLVPLSTIYPKYDGLSNSTAAGVVFA